VQVDRRGEEGRGDREALDRGALGALGTLGYRRGVADADRGSEREVARLRGQALGRHLLVVGEGEARERAVPRRAGEGGAGEGGAVRVYGGEFADALYADALVHLAVEFGDAVESQAAHVRHGGRERGRARIIWPSQSVISTRRGEGR
jgi:hypothetical protein